MKHDWCSRISHHLTSADPKNFDQIEKILTSMISLTDVCRDDFISVLPILDRLNHYEDSTYMEILNNLRTNLKQILGSDL